MTETTLPENRWQTIRDIWKEFKFLYEISGGLVLVLIGIGIGALIFAEDSGYGTNIYTEVMSVILTIFVLDRLQDRRDARNRVKDLQDQLVRDAGSSVNKTAITAIEKMRKRGWLGRKGDTEALLMGADLTNADLHDADLNHVNLSGADLASADLSGADLAGTNFRNANLGGANLIATYLPNADFTKAVLWNTNLSCADLSHTNFTGANIMEANLDMSLLSNANLSDAKLWYAWLGGALINNTRFNTNTGLPSESKWRGNDDLVAFRAEMREVIDMHTELDSDYFTYRVFTFADDTQRRWQRGKGWLDDVEK